MDAVAAFLEIELLGTPVAGSRPRREWSLSATSLAARR